MLISANQWESNGKTMMTGEENWREPQCPDDPRRWKKKKDQGLRQKEEQGKVESSESAVKARMGGDL